MSNYWSDSFAWISLSFGLIDFYIIKQLQSYPVIMPTGCLRPLFFLGTIYYIYIYILNIKDNVLCTK